MAGNCPSVGYCFRLWGSRCIMAIETTCPQCHKDYVLSDAQAGRMVRCKECNEAFRVPDLVGSMATPAVLDVEPVPPAGPSTVNSPVVSDVPAPARGPIAPSTSPWVWGLLASGLLVFLALVGMAAAMTVS